MADRRHKSVSVAKLGLKKILWQSLLSMVAASLWTPIEKCCRTCDLPEAKGYNKVISYFRDFLRLLRLPGTSGMLLTFQGLTSLESSDMTQRSHSWRMGYRCSDLWTLVPPPTSRRDRHNAWSIGARTRSWNTNTSLEHSAWNTKSSTHSEAMRRTVWKQGVNGDLNSPWLWAKQHAPSPRQSVP